MSIKRYAGAEFRQTKLVIDGVDVSPMIIVYVHEKSFIGEGVEVRVMVANEPRPMPLNLFVSFLQAICKSYEEQSGNKVSIIQT